MKTSQEFDVVSDDGVRLHAERWPAVGTDRPLVLGLHGITANRLGFLELIDELAGEVDFVAFDARGRGRSDKPADRAAYGHRRHAEDAAVILRNLGRPAAVVVGQSMGAWDGLQLAAHRPHLVGALVLADGGYFADLPAGVTPDDYVASVMGAGWQERLTAVLPSREVLLDAFKALRPFAVSWNDGLERMLLEGVEDVPEGGVRARCARVAAEVDAVDYFTPFGERPYVRRDLALVRCPVHLVRAERGFDLSPETSGPLLPEAAVEAFRAELPQLSVETVPGTNHYSVNFGRPGVVVLADAVRKALS